MDTLQLLMNLVLHLDQHLANLIATYGLWTYALLFLIIFCETGLVVTPFLPGDSLLFAAGALSANTISTLNIHLLFLLLVAASITGNLVNYSIGRYIGPRIFSSKKSWIFNPGHLQKAHAFYQNYGGKTIIIARFIPIIRTFAPFVAGVGYMSYRRFFTYNVIGALLWVGSLLYTSYLFGNIPAIQQHFSLIVLMIIGISLLPPFIEFARHAFKK